LSRAQYHPTDRGVTYVLLFPSCIRTLIFLKLIGVVRVSCYMQCLPSVDRYMKYLYTYECEKRQLSTPAELQVAIEGNRREGRRSSYGTYSEMVQRSPVPNLPPSHPSQMSPLSLVTSGRPAMNGNSNHHPTSHPSVHGQPLGAGMQRAIIFIPREFGTM